MTVISRFVATQIRIAVNPGTKLQYFVRVYQENDKFKCNSLDEARKCFKGHQRWLYYAFMQDLRFYVLLFCSNVSD